MKLIYDFSKQIDSTCRTTFCRPQDGAGSFSFRELVILENLVLSYAHDRDRQRRKIQLKDRLLEELHLSNLY